MAKRLLLALVCLGVVAAAQSPAMTTITDTVWNAPLTITVAPAASFTTADGFDIAGGYPFTVTSSTGSFSISLPPNASSMPASYYIAHYTTAFRSWNETWIVPSSGTPIKLSAVRSLLPPTPTYVFAFSQILAPANCILLGGFVQDTALGWTCNSSAGGGVTTFNGRAGVVVPATNDYTFAQLGGSPTATQIAAAGALSNSTSGNAATATSLAATPSQCPSTQIVTGVTAAGNANCQDPLVSGPTATGAAPGINNPIFIAGWDGTNVRSLLTDTSGHAIVTINGTVPVTGTFWQPTQPVSLASLPALPTGSNTIGAVNQAGAPWAFQGNAANGSAASGNPNLVAGSDGTNARTLLTDATGKLNVIGTFWQATQPVSLASIPALPTGGNTIGAVNQAGAPWAFQGNAANGSAASGNPSLVAGSDGTNARTLLTDATGKLNVIGTFWQAIQPVSGTATANQGTAGSSPWPVEPQPTSTAAQAPTAYTTTNLTSAATIDPSPGNVFHYEATNSGTAACYVEFFNAASGSVTLGTTAPIWTVPLLATSSNGYSRNSAPTVGGLFSFGTALSAAAVTTAGGSTTCPANVITLNAGYK